MKAKRLRVQDWRAKQATRDAVKTAVLALLWRDETGLPAASYDEEEIPVRAELVYRHIYARYRDAEHHAHQR